MNGQKSYRQILRSSSIIGGASLINIIIGIVKVKVLAVLLGPAGVGLMGLYQNIMGMASTLAGCGMCNSGVRELAKSVAQESTLAIVRRTLWLTNLILGLAAMVLLWLLREPVAFWVFGDTAHASEVGWLGPGVFLSLMAGTQTALLQGLRRIGDLARVTIISAMLGAITGIALVYFLGKNGVLWYVLTAPAVSVMVAGYYAARLPQSRSQHDWQAISQQWKAMLKLGLPFMATGVLGFVMQLAARSIILREHGLEATGHFQAAWAISMTYLGFVLGAMGTDYYPRLTAAIDDHPQARKMVNEQSEIALMLASPVLLGMITFAPWAIQLLYAESFSPATDLLRWQILGDILKVASWPMGFILLAKGNGNIFFAVEQIWNMVYLGILYLGIGKYGIVIGGVAFFAAYLIYYGVILILASSLIGFRISLRHVLTIIVLLLAGALIISLASQTARVAYNFGALGTLIAGLYSVYRINLVIDLKGLLGKKYKRP